MSPEPPPPLRPAGARAAAAPTGGHSARAREFRRILAEMLKIDRVRGGLVVAADGLVITASLPRSVAGERWRRWRPRSGASSRSAPTG